MKKINKSILIILFVIFSGYSVLAQSEDTINVLYGSSPVINGTLSPDEWDDASTITYEAGFPGDEMTVTCYFKHNGIDTLYIAQHIPNMHNGDRNLICFDVEHNGGNNPQTDDFSCNRYHLDTYLSWEGTGTGSDWDYSTPVGWFCALTGAAWGWAGDLGEIEFAIVFSKLGITAGNPKIFGFNILFGELLGNYNPDVLWSWSTNGDYFIPNTWGNMASTDNWGNGGVGTAEKIITGNHHLKNYPNPFSQSTVIGYQLSVSCEVILKIYNLSGKEVQTLVNENQSAGKHSVVWDGKDFKGNKLTNRLYFCKLITGKQVDTKKMLYLP